MSDWMSDLEGLRAESVAPYQKRCRVAVVLDQVTEEQRVALSDLLEPGSTIASAKVAAVLTKWGYPISYQSVQRHRRRGTAGTGCLCP